MNKEKIKDFVEEHKVEIAVVTTWAVTATAVIIGGKIGGKVAERKAREKLLKDEGICNILGLLKEAGQKYPQATIFTGNTARPLTMPDLGELGVRMAETCPYPEKNPSFTHFIAIGECTKKTEG